MDIEDIFKRSNFDFDKLITYGFTKDKNCYKYSKTFLDGDFLAEITINKNQKISGKVIDVSLNEEYTNIFVKTQNGEFINKVRDAYKEILNDIKEACTTSNYFIFSQSNKLADYIHEKYNVNPEFLWEKFKGYGIFRNKNNKKWFAIIMNLDKSKLGSGHGEVEVLNIKLDSEKVKNLLGKRGFYKAYHMNSNNWITIILNEEIDDKIIFNLLDESYKNVDNKK